MDFDDLAHKYDGWFETPLGAYVDACEKELTWGLAAPQSGEKVLDIGTGTANYLLELADRGLECTGIEPNASMIRVAREKARRRGLDVDLLSASADALPFNDRSFDLVLSVTAFEFFPDPPKAVREMRRVCRPGGRIVVGVLNKWSTWTLKRRIVGLFRDTIFRECRFYSYPEMRRLFGPGIYASCVYAPPECPEPLVPFFARMEPHLSKWVPFVGAYLALRVDT